MFSRIQWILVVAREDVLDEEAVCNRLSVNSVRLKQKPSSATSMLGIAKHLGICHGMTRPNNVSFRVIGASHTMIQIT